MTRRLWTILDALALLDVARLQTAHPAPPIDPEKVAYAFATLVAGTLDEF
jgi:hypothetical protein